VGVAVAPELVLPGHDAAGGVELRLQIERHGRAVGLPRELILAHPLQLHRPAVRGTREQRRVEGRVVGAVVAVAARAFGMGHRYFFYRKT
jgi:hypothetical protein